MNLHRQVPSACLCGRRHGRRFTAVDLDPERVPEASASGFAVQGFNSQQRNNC